HHPSDSTLPLHDALPICRSDHGRGAGSEAGQEGRVGKSPRTWEEWAPYGIGEPDEYGIYPDYRTPEAFAKEASGRGVSVPWSALDRKSTRLNSSHVSISY